MPEHATFLCDRSDDGESLADDPDILADRIHVLEQLLGHVRADDRDRCVIAHIDVADGAPVVEHVVLDDLVRRGDAEYGDIGLRLVAPYDVGNRSGPAGLHADRHCLRDRGNYRVRIRLGDARPPLQLFPLLIVEESDADRSPSHLESVRANERAGEVLLHVRVHARDDGDDGDEERHGHDDPEQREKGAQLVDADLLERSGDYIDEAHNLISAKGALAATQTLLNCDCTGRRRQWFN